MRRHAREACPATEGRAEEPALNGVEGDAGFELIDEGGVIDSFNY